MVHPWDSINSSEIGSKMNWPKDPTDIEIPSANERRSAGTTLLMAPNTTGKVVPDKPMPIRPPVPRINAVDESCVAMISRPSA